MNYGEILKERREHICMSQGELAKKAGCTTRAIQYWERGDKQMRMDMADKVFKALGIAITIGATEDKA